MSKRLAATFRRAARRETAAAPGLRLTLPDLLQMHGQASTAVLLMLAALLSAVPIAGAGTVLAFLILAIAWRWPRSAPVLPQRLGALALSERWSRRCLAALAWIYGAANAFLRSRWTVLCHQRLHAWWAGWIAAMGLVILLPLPLGNLLPSLSLVLLSLGWMFRDGLTLLLSALVGTGGIAFGLATTHWLVQAAGRAWDWLRPFF